MNSSLEGYLQSLSAEGEIDSEGVFTVDLSQGLNKMAQFQLPSPHHYVLRLVSVAALLKAKALDISGTSYQREFALEGEGFTAQEMRDLFASFLSDSSLDCRVRALRNLALAIYAAARLPGCVVSGNTWQGESGARWQLEAGRLSIQTLEQKSFRWIGTRVEVRLQRSLGQLSKGLLQALSGYPLTTHEDIQLLRRYARYCQVPIILEGQNFTLERQGRWEKLLFVNQSRLLRHLKPLASGEQTQISLDYPFYGYLGKSPSGGGLMVVVDGLLYPVPQIEDPQFRGLLWHDHLQRDLTLLHLVQDDGLEQFLGQVRQLYQSLK